MLHSKPINFMETYITTLEDESQNINSVNSITQTELENLPIAKTKQELDKEINDKIEKNINAAQPYFRCVLNFGDLLDLNGSGGNLLLELSSLNPNLQLETDRNNNLIILMPTKFNTSKNNLKLGVKVSIWNDEHELGEVTDSNGAFQMPVTKSIYAPDVAFVLHSKLEQIDLTDGVPTIAPDFVIELRSDSDRLKNLIAKMEEYIENGVRLGWLIDPQTENVHIYRLNGNNTMQNFDESLSGEDVLPKFELNLRSIFKKK